MNKRIAVLGAAYVWGDIATFLTHSGFDPIHPKQIDHKPNRFKHKDLTNTARQPIKSSYAVKQRKRKNMRKGK